MATQVYVMKHDPNNNYSGGFGGYSDQPNSGGNNGYGDPNGDGQPQLSPYNSQQNLNVSGLLNQEIFFLSKLLFSQSDNDNHVSRVNTTLHE